MSAIPTQTLTLAFKEWAIAVDALAQAQTILLLRKGGIREQGGTFQIPQRQLWLYPTYEHQKPQLLKPEYAALVNPVASGWHPVSVEIRAWAEITHTFQVSEPAAVEALLPFHIWNSAFVAERLKWKPKTPLTALLLRVYRLAQPRSIPYLSAYGGCKSWINLQAELPTAPAAPVLAEADYLRRVGEIESSVEEGMGKDKR